MEIVLQVGHTAMVVDAFCPVFMRVCEASYAEFPEDFKAELREAAIYAITIKQA